MTHEDIVSLARAAHGHPMKLTDLRQVCFFITLLHVLMQSQHQHLVDA